MKEAGLAGYRIPEMDYTRGMMSDELKRCGGSDVIILPHNLFGYLPFASFWAVTGVFLKLCYYAVQCMPVFLFPEVFAYRHAGTLVGIARKAG
jgi:hypothetical protein